MARVDISINGRTFRIGCGEGEEAHLRLLADHLRRHIDNLRARFSAVGDDELYLMAALQVCDELYDARSELQLMESDARQRTAPPAASPTRPPVAENAPPAVHRAESTVAIVHPVGPARSSSEPLPSAVPPAPLPVEVTPPAAVQPPPAVPAPAQATSVAAPFTARPESA